MSSNTRSQPEFIETLLGSAKPLKQDQLPLISDVMLALSHERLVNKSTINPMWTKIREKVAVEVKTIWDNASTPTKSLQRIKDMIESLNNEVRSLRKSHKRYLKSQLIEQKHNKFQDKCSMLFDIAACQCKNNCKCPNEKKVPKKEQRFLKDQHTQRKMVIGGTDMTNSSRKVKIYLKKEQNVIDIQQPSTSGLQSSNTVDTSDSSTPLTSADEEEFEMPPAKKKKNLVTPLPSVAEAADRVGISQRGAAFITSAVLQDFGIITENDTSQVIDKCKIHRERTRARTIKVQAAEAEQGTIRAIFFDGKKDTTLEIVDSGSSKGHKSKTQEHYTILEEPGSKYLTHVSPKSSSAADITESIVEFLDDKDCDLIAAGCDGTVTNTGHNNGILARIEQHIGQNINWLVCLLHANELPLRHLIYELDGKPKGPSSFPGPIGQAFHNCESLPVIDFVPVIGEMITVDIPDLSADQKYLAEMHEAVRSGHVSNQLSKKDPGNVNLARWLTIANRILRLYISTDNPSETLGHLVEFVMNVYVPTWFDIKINWKAKDGAINQYRMIMRVKELKDHRSREIASRVIQRNGFFCHPENILVAMICDQNPILRQLGWKKI